MPMMSSNAGTTLRLSAASAAESLHSSSLKLARVEPA